MREYETVFILNTEISVEKREKTIDKVRKFINKKGSIIKEEDLGVKKLAYEIKKQSKGYYYIIEFMLHSKDIAKLERLYRIDDEVIKFIVFRKD